MPIVGGIETGLNTPDEADDDHGGVELLAVNMHKFGGTDLDGRFDGR